MIVAQNTYKTLGIKAWSVEDRPREKLEQKGKHTLTDAELIAILLRSGTPNRSAVDVSKELLNSVENDLEKLSELNTNQLTRIKGVGLAKAITITAALELGRRSRFSDKNQKQIISCSRDAYQYFYKYLSDLQQEQFFILLLKRNNKVIKHKQISAGGISGTIVDPKSIFKHAIEELASSIILCHNHPSGNLKPSQADIDLTNKLVNAGKLLDISVIDHIIFTNSAYFSFADENLL